LPQFKFTRFQVIPSIPFAFVLIVSEMLASSFFYLLASSYLVHSAPIITGVKLDPAATAEAQQRDDAATRAFTAAQIKVGS